MILGCLGLYIPLLWLTPYMQITFIAFYERVSKSKGANFELSNEYYEESTINSFDTENTTVSSVENKKDTKKIIFLGVGIFAMEFYS